jgi:hypothetical protein
LIEWNKVNPVLCIAYIAIAVACFFFVISSNKTKQKQESRNKISLCAKCGSEYSDNTYYSVRRFNYCSSCFASMLRDAKWNLGLSWGLVIIFLTLFPLNYLQEYATGSFKKDDFIRFLKFMPRFMALPGIFIWQLHRELRKLKKADQPKKQL